MIVYDLKVNGIINPIGYDFKDIIVSWSIGETKAIRLKSVNVSVSVDSKMENIIYDETGLFDCTGYKVDIVTEPYTRYYIEVIVIGDNNETGRSQVAYFETGRMDEKWVADWITTKAIDNFHPVFEKQFSVAKVINSARLYITGVGLFEAKINDNRVSDEYLTPFFNDYNKAIQVLTFDVTQYLQTDNTISILLGNGWYKGRIGYSGLREYWGDRFACIAELRICYADGTVETVATDASWKYYKSNIIMSDIYYGEHIDANIKDRGNAKNAVVYNYNDKKLCERVNPPIKIMEKIPAKAIINTKRGDIIIDFGQNFAGIFMFKSNLKKGEVIKFTCAEILQEGEFYHDNYRSAKAEFIYKSDGSSVWVRPHFTYYGFRYLKVEGDGIQIDIEDIVGLVLYSEMERTGYLKTGNEKVNRLIENALWGMKSNSLAIPTDCPQRDERLGWTGDAQVFSSTASFFMDTRAFYNKFLWDIRQDQKDHKGAISSSLPFIEGGMIGASVWADAATIIPKNLFDAYGDVYLLRKHYSMMKEWVEYIRTNDELRDDGPKYLYDFGFTFGDWLAMDGPSDESVIGSTDAEYISSIYYYASVKNVEHAAEVLGYESDRKKYSTLAGKIKEAILYHYFTESGRLAIDTQTGYIIALYFGVYSNIDELKKGLYRRLRNDGYKIKCGFVGAPLLCRVLAENGMEKLAYHFLLQEEYPSWLNCVNLGATTIWERWNSVGKNGRISQNGMNSLNHYAFGSVVDYIVKNIAGLKMIKPGYKKALIAPSFDSRLQSVELEYKSSYGIYKVSWDILDEYEVSVRIIIPFDCSAEVKLPEYSRPYMLLPSGEYSFRYKTQKNYKCLFDNNSTFEDLSKNAEAMEILKADLPQGYMYAKGTNPETRCLSLHEIETQPWYGFDTKAVQDAEEKIFKIMAF